MEGADDLARFETAFEGVPVGILEKVGSLGKVGIGFFGEAVGMSRKETGFGFTGNLVTAGAVLVGADSWAGTRPVGGRMDGAGFLLAKTGRNFPETGVVGADCW